MLKNEIPELLGMGLMNFGATKKPFGKFVIKRYRLICFGLYVTGIIWFILLGNSNLNSATGISENALSPGNNAPRAPPFERRKRIH